MTFGLQWCVGTLIPPKSLIIPRGEAFPCVFDAEASPRHKIPILLFPHQSPDFSVVVTRDTKRNPCHRMRLSYVGHEPTEVKFKMSWRRAKAKMQLAAALVQELRLKHKEV